MYYANIIQKEVGVAMLISDKIKAKIINSEGIKGCHFFPIIQ